MRPLDVGVQHQGWRGVKVKVRGYQGRDESPRQSPKEEVDFMWGKCEVMRR